MNRFSFTTIMTVLTMITLLGLQPVKCEARHVDVIQISDSINPAVNEFIAESISRAEAEQAECLIIQLDTPGGLLTSTKDIVIAILNSKIPVVVYISPRGSWAASAGTFITLASDIAAMAPSTNIGAAHPVNIVPQGQGQQESEPDSDETMDRLEKKLDKFIKELGSGRETGKRSGEKTGPHENNTTNTGADSEDETQKPKKPQKSDVMNEKIMQHTTSWIRSIAELRGRNADWAEKAVTESKSITETEALAQNVIDLIADDLEDLLTKINGREVTKDSDTIALNTEKVQINRYEMSFRQRLLSTISNPDLFFILALLGPLGLVIELYNPGLILPGVVGGISIILLLYGSQVLPVNFAAMLLIILAIVLFIAEIKIQSYGLLTVGGVLCIFLGGLMLFRTGPDLAGETFRVSYWTIFSVTGVIMAFVFVVLQRIVSVHNTSSVTGSQGLVGAIGEARTEVGLQGKIFVHGELWNARSDVPIEKGKPVKVIDVQGLNLKVREHKID
ncbi:nodulation protein NfeD [bacterium]|nr:nodulation protein NfeD [bacterium]